MHDPREPYHVPLKRILQYIRSSLHLGLLLRPLTQSDLVVYFDTDWTNYPDACKFISGYAVFLGGQPRFLVLQMLEHRLQV